MASDCVDIICRDCGGHVLKGGKISCNHEDRLGLGRSMLATVVEEEIEKEGEPSGT